MNRSNSERGASAVEFALVVPLLLVILLGIVEFGHIYNAQLQVTSAARELVREVAISNGKALTTEVKAAAAPGLTGYSVNSSGCSSNPAATVTVTVEYTVKPLTTFLENFLEGAIPTLEGKAVMRCGG